MAATAETLRTRPITAPRISLYVAATAAVRRWSSRSQLGLSSAAGLGRHTGARC